MKSEITVVIDENENESSKVLNWLHESLQILVLQMGLEKELHGLLDKWHPKLRRKIDPTEIFQDIEGLTDFDKNEIKGGFQISTWNGYDELKNRLKRRPLNTFHSFISVLESNN